MRIDRYIFVEWLKVFLLTLMVVLGILLIADIQNDLQDLLAFGANAGTVFSYYWIKFPSFLPIVLPMTFMLSLLFTLAQLHRNMEITAMRAAGLSLFRITRSLWLTGLLLTALLFHLNANLVPRSMEQSRDLWNELAFQQALAQETPVEEVGLLFNLTFYNRRDGRMWFINRFSEYDYQAYGITLSTIRPEDQREVERIVANRGFFDDVNRTWHFISGRRMTFDADSGEIVRSLPFEQLELAGLGEDPALMKFLEKRPKDLSLWELRRVIEYLRPQEDGRLAPYAVAFYDRLMNPFMFLIILGLAIPFSVSGVRTNPFVGVSKSMGLFLLYLVLINAGQIAGANGLNPFWAAALPNLGAFALVLYYNWRLRRPQ